MKFGQNIKYRTAICPLCKLEKEVYSGKEWTMNNSFYCSFCKRCVVESKKIIIKISKKGRYFSKKKHNK